MPLTRLGRLGRLWRTVRHLRAEQIVGRAWFRLHRPRPDLRAAPALRGTTGAWVRPAERAASMPGPNRLRFLNVEHTLDDSAAAWDDTRMSRLWRYNLHYFDDLNAAGHRDRARLHHALIQRWIAQNPPPHGSGWEPYPTALRIVNWIKWLAAGGAPQPGMLDSLAVQTRWLRRRLEWHLLGNHLFANGKALIAAGLYFDGPEAASWLASGSAIVQREFPAQILADGGQFERSPMYHALALEDLLDLINLARSRAPQHGAVRGALLPELQRRAPAMLHWLRCMRHGDGTLAHFNDSADGIAPDNAELERYAAALGVTATQPPAGDAVLRLPDSGYIRASSGRALLLADVAELGADYLVGHAHADTLSFELSLGAQRVVVNGGTSRYGLGPERLRERGTAAHSTVQVDGQDSSEVWSGFRVGRRARPQDLQVQGNVFSCAHDGYRHLPGAPRHRRSWTLQPTSLQVDDAVQPPVHTAVARFHLAPGLQLMPVPGGSWTVHRGALPIAQVEVLSGTARRATSQHAPRFGVVLPVDTLEVDLQDGVASTCWTWTAHAHPLSD